MTEQTDGAEGEALAEPTCQTCGHRLRSHYVDGCIQCDGCRTSFEALLAAREVAAEVRGAQGVLTAVEEVVIPTMTLTEAWGTSPAQAYIKARELTVAAARAAAAAAGGGGEA